MDEQQGPDQPDVLDRMLTAYGEVDVPAGLESRVLRQIERAHRRRQRRLWLFLAAPAAAAAASFVLLLSGPPDIQDREPAPVIPSISDVRKEEDENVRPADPSVAALSQSLKVRVRHKPSVPEDDSATQDSSSPRLSTFPAPSQPSDQEQALAFLMRSRQETLVELAQLNPSRIRERIDIVPIKTDVLALEKLGSEQDQVGESGK
jgi:hypothetical protein